MAKKIPYDDRIEQIKQKSKDFTCVRDFYRENPYLYRWALKNNINLRKYFPQRQVRCKYEERENKGIDCYVAKTKKLHKHYAFIIDALRELDLTYYYVHKVLNGDIPSIDGYIFTKCS